MFAVGQCGGQNMKALHYGMVQLSVEQDGHVELVYALRDLEAAGEMFRFLRDFFPAARFVIEPLPH